jgi:hypothetical protein
VAATEQGCESSCAHVDACAAGIANHMLVALITLATTIILNFFTIDLRSDISSALTSRPEIFGTREAESFPQEGDERSPGSVVRSVALSGIELAHQPGLRFAPPRLLEQLGNALGLGTREVDPHAA